MSHSYCSNEDQQRSRELLVLPAGGGVRRQRLGPGPDAEKTYAGEISTRGLLHSGPPEMTTPFS